MILQVLYDYYERKAAEPESNIAPIGFEWKEIPFLIIIDKDGDATRLYDTREKVGKKLIGNKFLLPQSVGRSGSKAWAKTFLLWDHYGYVLGHPKSDQKEDSDMGQKQLDTFINRLKSLPELIRKDEGVAAVLQFYEKKEYKKVFTFNNWQECANINGCNLSFRLEGEAKLILSRDVIKEYQKSQALVPDKQETYEALCLVSGKVGIVQRIHDSTPIPGGQSTGKLVGFQKKSGFDSYGKEQGFNAPVSKYAHAAYTTALNTLAKSERNRMLVGDTTTVFWAEKACELEQNLPLFFTGPPKNDPDKGVRAVKQLYKSIESGKLSTESKNSFFVLGLAPNAARISIRYWLTGTVREFAEKIKQHFYDLEIDCSKKDEEYFSLKKLLSHTALQYKISNVPPNLAGAVTRAVLEGLPYPQSLLQACVRRIRAEQHVTRIRAAILKACINRYNRFNHTTDKEEIAMALDKTNMNPAYRLGRLFAVLERIQIKSVEPRKLNSTIRDRYYGAFSSTPVTVFQQLMKLKNHHLAKLEKGKNFFEGLIGEIIDGLDGSGDIPRQFSLNDQARFAIGYYHQRQDFFKKSPTNE